jgi:hypothetical protein
MVVFSPLDCGAGLSNIDEGELKRFRETAKSARPLRKTGTGGNKDQYNLQFEL